MAKSPWLGLVGMAFGVATLSIQRSETYSDYGLYVNQVEVKCGTAFDDKVETEFDNPDEEYYYNYYDRIFDGKTAEEVCEELDRDGQLVGWGAAGLGTVWLIAGLAVASSRQQNAMGLGSPVPLSGSSPTPNHVSNANPPRWLPDPQGIWEQRYWDGTRWTEHVVSGGRVGTHPVSAPPPGFGAAGHAQTPLRAQAPSAPAPAPASAPAPSAPDHDGRTISRAAMAGPRTAASARMRFDDGTTWEGSGPVLIGREPAGQPGESPTGLHAIADPTRSVSKTHLLVTPTAGGVQIVDRHSSNGTEIVVAGVTMASSAGVATDVPFGATVRFGDRSFIVERLG